MPDKDFDKLFQDNFADAEIVPSRDLWGAIEEKLEPKRKKIIPIYWMAAATVAVAFTAMMVFQKEEKIQLQGSGSLTAQNLPVDTNANMGEEAKIVKELVLTDAKTTKFASKPVVTVSKSKSAEKEVVENNLKNFDIAMQPKDESNHLLIKKTEAMPLNVLPKEEEVLADNQTMYANADVKKDMSSNVIGSETEAAVERKGIRNVGDLVNLVMDKVDKRENKMIKFNTDDDDNSSIIGINIGILKFNKKHK